MSSRSGTTTAQAHKMTQTYKITAASSVQGKGLLKPKRAAICTIKTMNIVKNKAPPMTLAALLNQRVMFALAYLYM